MEAAAIAHGHTEHDHHGPPPANRSSRVEPQLLGMLLFIISEIMVFGAFFTAYFFIRVVQGDQWFQVNEYVHIGFAPHDFAQGSVFYGLTGLHGAHVFVGLTLLLFVVIRSWRGHYSVEEHRGVEVPGIYWHFVDVMWIVVFTSVYV